MASEKGPPGKGKGKAKDALLFLDVSNASEDSKASNRKKARAHIMNQYHRKHRNAPNTADRLHVPAATRAGSTPASRSLSSSASPVSRNFEPGHIIPTDLLQQQFHLFGWNNTVIRPHLFGIPNPGVFDLVQFPFHLSRRDEMLLHHYGQVFNHSNIPVWPKTDWLTVAAMDDAVLHATLIVSALHIGLLLKKKISPDALRHYSHITKILSNRFNDPTKSQTDATILTVACLTLMEIMNASPLKAEPHVKALEHLTARRGGVDSLGLNGMIKRKVLWADLSSAIAQQIPPRFKHEPTPWDPNISPIDMSNSDLCNEALRLSTETNNPVESSQIFEHLQSLSYAISLINRSENPTDDLALSDYFYDCEWKAYDFYSRAFKNASSPSPNEPPSSYTPLYLASCVAIIMYSNIALREIPIQAGMFAPFISSLLQLLDGVDLEAVSRKYPLMLCWVLAIGGIVSYERPERQQYVQLFSRFCKSQGYGDWDTVKSCFLDNVYVTPLYVSEFRDFWNDVEEEWILDGLS